MTMGRTGLDVDFIGILMDEGTDLSHPNEFIATELSSLVGYGFHVDPIGKERT